MESRWIAGPERSGAYQSRAKPTTCDRRPVILAADHMVDLRFRGPRSLRNIRASAATSSRADAGKSFQISKPVARARVYSSGLAYNRLTVNGKPASDSVLDPSFTITARRCSNHAGCDGATPAGRKCDCWKSAPDITDDATRRGMGLEQAEWRATPSPAARFVHHLPRRH